MAVDQRKVAWRDLPTKVRGEVEQRLGSRVLHGRRASGGYTPSVTLHLRLDDGRRALLKAVAPDSSAMMHGTIRTEMRVYGELGDTVLEGWVPRCYGAFTKSGWDCLLLEDLGASTIPPWTSVSAEKVARSYARFHASLRGVALPDWVPPVSRMGSGGGWEDVARDEEALEGLARLASGDSADARGWLDGALPALASAERAIDSVEGPHALLHLDTRSDNMRLLEGGLRIFDWPWIGVGPPELDLVVFAQSVPLEGGPPAEAMVGWYAQEQPVRDEVLTGCIASVAAFFAEQAWRPNIDSMPRLRAAQRRQLGSSLRWAAARLELPQPSWLDGA